MKKVSKFPKVECFFISEWKPVKQISEKQKHHTQMLQLSRALKAEDEERQKDRRRDLIFNSDSELGRNVVAEKKKCVSSKTSSIFKYVHRHLHHSFSCTSLLFSTTDSAPNPATFLAPFKHKRHLDRKKRTLQTALLYVLKSGGGKHW